MLKFTLSALSIGFAVSCSNGSDGSGSATAASPDALGSVPERTRKSEATPPRSSAEQVRQQFEISKKQNTACANTPSDLRVIPSQEWIVAGHEIGEPYESSGFEANKRCSDAEGCSYVDEHRIRYGYSDYLYSVEARLDEVEADFVLPLGLRLGATYQEVIPIIMRDGRSPWLIATDPGSKVISLVSNFAIESSNCSIYWVDMQFVDGRMVRFRLNEPST